VSRAAAVACAAAAIAAGGTGAGASAAETPLELLVGQRLVVALAGTEPTNELLERVRRGHVGGVILFGANARSPSQVAALTARLRAAAAAAGRPRPLVLVDQEGGAVRRLRWAPPGLSAAELGVRPVRDALAAGRATGRALRRAGIDVDLAPVADVPGDASSFLVTQGRAFGTRPRHVLPRVAAFARGLREQGVHATAKHFPGLGRAGGNTDVRRVVVPATRSELLRDAAPFAALVRADVPLVMLANAVYPALGPEPAAWEPAVHRLLRRGLGFTGATITDALEAAALAAGVSTEEAAVRAARAGVDLLLLTGPEHESDAVFRRLLAAARSGALSRASLQRSHDRVLALKAR
jgi:beta-N-acetylhexosaminidase